MRIGFDAKRFFFNKTGLGNYSRDLIRILEEYYPANDYIKYTPKRNESITATNIKVPKGKINTLFNSLWRNQWIVQDLVSDHIQLYHGLSGEIPKGLKNTDIKSVVTIHDLIFLKFPDLYKPIDRILYNNKFKYAVNNADKIIAISEQTKKDIVHYYKIEADKIGVIYQGCHPAFKTIKTEEQKNTIRKKYNLPERFLLNVGSIEPRKNALQIVKAIESSNDQLVIIGKETKYSAEIRQYINHKGLEDRVHILQGFTMDELSTIYAMADIFIYPSKYEGFGIPIIEALYAGTPVITTNSGVFPEAGGPSSYYINPDDINEIRDAIHTILANENIRTEMIYKGLAYVKRFDDDVIATQWQQVYTDILKTD